MLLTKFGVGEVYYYQMKQSVIILKGHLFMFVMIYLRLLAS